MKSERVNILRVEKRIADYLRKQGVTDKGNQYLEGADILENAGILPYVLKLAESGADPLEVIRKAVAMGDIAGGSEPAEIPTEKEPEPESRPPMFGS